MSGFDPISAISSVVDDVIKIFPNADQKQQVALAQLQATVTEAQQQTDTNKVEAASANVFVAGWRPFVGWVGGAGLAYATILEPIARFVATMCHYVGPFPVIDTSLTMQLLTGLLGLGALRSYDKKQGTSPQSHA